MEMEQLKSYLKQAIDKNSKRDFEFFMKLYESYDTVNEYPEDGKCQIKCSVQQFYEEGNESWLDVFINVSDEDIEIGSNIVFHRNGEIELPKKVFLHRFEGLPKPIADL